MRIALLCGASPKSVVHGPSVYLRAGNWEFSHETQVDSLVSIISDGTELTKPFGKSAIHKLETDTIVSVRIERIGSEPYINVFAIRLG